MPCDANSSQVNMLWFNWHLGATLLINWILIIYCFFRCPQLETMSLKRSNMAQVVLNCPLLHELDIGSCHKLPDAAIRAAATSCPQLVSLDMSNCSCVSDETLREIASSCANLSFLDASYCPNISLEVCYRVCYHFAHID